MNTGIYEAINSIATRSDRNPDETLFSTFADEQGHLSTLLKSIDNHIIYGRRGTGKTHAIKYLQGALDENKHVSVFLDLRTFGSESAYYKDTDITADRRAVKLFLDIFKGIHAGLKHSFKSQLKYGYTIQSELSKKIDSFEDVISDTIIDGMSEFEKKSSLTTSTGAGGELDVSLDISKTKSKVGISANHNKGYKNTLTENIKGNKKPYLNLRSITIALEEILDLINQERLWILFDEWATIPEDVQPYLADLIRRSLFPAKKVTIKIVAIDFRTNFMLARSKGDYIGFELGADISTSIDLDDFLVFENNSIRSGDFYSELLFNHYRAYYFSDEIPLTQPQTKEELIDRIFCSKRDFREFVRSAEGVPRDALNILSKATQSAGGHHLQFKDILTGSRVWSRNDKESTLSTYPIPKAAFGAIRKHILKKKPRGRLILIREGSKFDIVKQLIDLRVIHVQLKDYIVSNDDAYNYTIFSIDYGCYVNWITAEIFDEGEIMSDLSYSIIPSLSFKNLRSSVIDIEEIESVAARMTNTTEGVC